MPVRYPISYRASRYIHTLVPAPVRTITHSLLPRGYSQFASCLRRDPSKGKERKRPYSPRSHPLKAALLGMDKMDISACNSSFVGPISIRLEIGCPSLGCFPILSLCLRRQLHPIYH